MKIGIAILMVALSGAAQHPEMPQGMSHEEHLKQMEKDAALAKRGAEAMGFDQAAAVHHFRLAADGGSIEVEVKDAADETTLSQIRAHLTEVAAEFSRGEFGKPRQTHGEEPPGVAVMHQRKDALAYTFESTPHGGRVRIRTADPEALGAVHAFLRYQIAEHKTGDSTAVK